LTYCSKQFCRQIHCRRERAIGGSSRSFLYASTNLPFISRAIRRSIASMKSHRIDRNTNTFFTLLRINTTSATDVYMTLRSLGWLSFPGAPMESTC
jgi:hypothetical protein